MEGRDLSALTHTGFYNFCLEVTESHPLRFSDQAAPDSTASADPGNALVEHTDSIFLLIRNLVTLFLGC
jgi:hypothetical protein